MMQSDINTLKSRGYIDDVDIVDYLNLSRIELMGLLEDKEPVMRSIGARVISQIYNMDEEEIVNKTFTKKELSPCQRFDGKKSRENVAGDNTCFNRGFREP